MYNLDKDGQLQEDVYIQLRSYGGDIILKKYQDGENYDVESFASWDGNLIAKVLKDSHYMCMNIELMYFYGTWETQDIVDDFTQKLFDDQWDDDWFYRNPRLDEKLGYIWATAYDQSGFEFKEGYEFQNEYIFHLKDICNEISQHVFGKKYLEDGGYF